MLRYLFILCAIGAALGKATDFNQLLDQVLDQLRPKIVELGKDQLPIDNIQYDWSYNVVFVKVYGDISCSNGKARYLSTIKRTGNASGDLTDGGLGIEASVGLEVMEFLFNSCVLSVKDIVSVQQSLGGQVGSNSLYIRIYLEGNMARIDSLKVTDLSDIQLTTGTNIIHRLENSVLNGLVNKFDTTIINSVNSQLSQFEGKTFKIPI